MNTTVKEFVFSNKNELVKWDIDGFRYLKKEYIPYDVLKKHVFDWTVNQWEGIIEITTEYR